jgi:plastocyanin
VALALLLALPLCSATVTGRFELIDSREASVRKQKDYSGVAVWLEPINRKASLPAPGVHTIRQKGKRFIPHISVIPSGTTVDLPNLDPIFHNAFSNFAGQPFDTGLYPPGGTQKIKFTRPGVVRVFCNIHSTMSAVILVVETPWYTVTGPDGSFKIDNVPPGEYQINVWHERARQDVLSEMTRKITIDDAGFAMPLARISESGYLELPHLNKYGKEYPPEPVERPAYSGAKRR